ncbi:MAG TPA: hypothetical protein PKA20_22895 [Burkholderiaceae bacterium]|nr:hypothetical protein [Burkholderiaceae bacterium]
MRPGAPETAGEQSAAAPRRDWVGKTLAGTLLGFALGISAGAFFVRFGPALSLPVTAQLAMWIVTPVWFTVLSLCFLFGSGLRAWAWLGGAVALSLVILLLAGPRPGPG